MSGSPHRGGAVSAAVCRRGVLCLCDESRFGFRIGEAAGQAAGAEIDHARTPHAVRFRQFAADPAFLQVLLQDRQRFFTAGTEHGAVALTAVLLQVLSQLPQFPAPRGVLDCLHTEQLLKFHMFAAL